MSTEVYLTKEGYEKILEELKDLKVEKREEIAERIKTAMEFGDLTENAEYDEAKAAQLLNENKIAELEEKIKSAVIIDEKALNTGKVEIGTTVYITNVSDKTEQKYTIVGPDEANVLENKISNVSPLGKSLLGNKQGDMIKVEAPVGIVEYEIKKITF